jgi:hypothetical protein
MSVRELSDLEDESSWWDKAKRLGRTAGLIMRIYGLSTHPLPVPALPVEPPPIVEVDRSRPKGQGSSGGRESEFGDRPQSRVMDRLGRLAARTPSELDAEAYVGALPTLAAELVPSAAVPLLASATRLGRGLSGTTRVLRADPATRGVVAALPAAARIAALRVGRQVRAGRPVTQDTCARMFAEETVRALRRAGVG